MKFTANNLKMMLGEDKINYKPYVAYEYYDGLYDEMAHRIDCVGVINNEIILSRDIGEFNAGMMNDPNKKCIIGCETIKDVIEGVNYLQNMHNEELPVKFKAYNNSINDIKEVKIDYELKRFVFVSEFSL